MREFLMSLFMFCAPAAKMQQALGFDRSIDRDAL
jgi:hypothetical protein